MAIGLFNGDRGGQRRPRIARLQLRPLTGAIPCSARQARPLQAARRSWDQFLAACGRARHRASASADAPWPPARFMVAGIPIVPGMAYDSCAPTRRCSDAPGLEANRRWRATSSHDLFIKSCSNSESVLPAFRQPMEGTMKSDTTRRSVLAGLAASPAIAAPAVALATPLISGNFSAPQLVT